MAIVQAAAFHGAPSLVRERLKVGTLWLLLASSSVVLFEPAPYDLLFIGVLALYLRLGMALSPRNAPLLILALTFNIGGAFALIPFLDQSKSVMFVVTSFYLGFMAFAFSNIVLENAERNLRAMCSGWIVAGLIAACCGIVGYFGIAGTGGLFTLYGRASGTFKDPNVLGPFLTVPCLLIMQGYMTGTLKRPVLSLAVFLVLVAGVFLSFSRGAWGVLVLGMAMMGALLFITTRSERTRVRIVGVAIAGLVGLAVLLAIALSVDSIREMFEQRAVLVQDYDKGSQGRFGKIFEAIPLLLERPNGIGPLRFTDFFPEAPHNVYINAFSAYGWLGGISYLCLIALTIRIGWRTVWLPTPWQGPYIALWSATFCQFLQGLQIDSDHWRHLWLLIGITWGCAAAAVPWSQRRARPSAASTASGPVRPWSPASPGR